MRYVIHSKKDGVMLDDKRIIKDMDKAKRFYEDGAIKEARNLIFYIKEALDYFCKNA